MKEDPLSVLVVDEGKVNQTGSRAILDRAPRIDVVGAAVSHREAINGQRRFRPDVVLINAVSPGIDARELTEIFAIGTDGPPVNVLVLVNDMDETAWGIFRSGARGVLLLKQSGPHRLIAALELVATGYVVLAYPRRPARPVPHRPANNAVVGPTALTARETEVLGQIGHGFSNARISRNLRIQETTVKTHVRSVLDKLALQNRVQAAVYAHRSGLVQNITEPGE